MSKEENILKFNSAIAKRAAFEANSGGKIPDDILLNDLIKILSICKEKAEQGRFGTVVKVKTSDDNGLISEHLRIRGFGVKKNWIDGDTFINITW